MGLKRSFENEEFQELPFKNMKCVESRDKLASFGEIVPCKDAPQKPDISDECSFYKFQCGTEGVENGVSVLDDKGFEISAPLSCNGSSEEDGRSVAAAYSSLSPEYFESYLPRRTVAQFEDIYSSLLDCSPRRQVPVGPDHQANVPTKTVDGENEERWMGTCVIPMPEENLSAENGVKTGDGRTDCGCLDNDSIRCVRQHVMEAREKLRKTLGQEKFMELGFCDMGEEVALKWHEEEEQAFHEVVFSHPASLGQNFWEHLSATFSYRAKQELVSYYFNVFMLRQRAAQNRSNFLYIDSDDDEWHGNNRSLNEVGTAEEEDDSGIESLSDQHNHAYHEEEPHEEDDDDDDDDDDDEEDDDKDDSDFDGDGGFGDDKLARNMDKVPDSNGEDFSVQDDSCMSFECQPNVANPCAPSDPEASVQESGARITQQKSFHGDDDGSSTRVDPGYLLEPSETKVWDGRYWTGSINGVDLLPTCNMIEEIFGLGTPNSKTKDDKSIS
ncbi:AT-rich interactive domain-containing protein 2 [Vitis vinifera]|uniref:AT-rich interactive domain-containing protein 2 n=1 Tax=Vitis vinifera TaxID=29760 RepID=A0A438J0W0_VITVI|nr:AT-rich interactive domain-containing protein 2 [Vitis vinifera]